MNVPAVSLIGWRSVAFRDHHYLVADWFGVEEREDKMDRLAKIYATQTEWSAIQYTNMDLRLSLIRKKNGTASSGYDFTFGRGRDYGIVGVDVDAGFRYDEYYEGFL